MRSWCCKQNSIGPSVVREPARHLEHAGDVNLHELLGQVQVVLAEGDLGELLVDGGTGVVEGGRLEDDAARASDAGEREHPEEETV